MLRVHFTADDVARVRVATAPDPLWEITNSFQALTEEDHTLAFGDWRRQVRPLLRPADGLLAALLPPRGYSPDFLTPDTLNPPSRPPSSSGSSNFSSSSISSSSSSSSGTGDTPFAPGTSGPTGVLGLGLDNAVDNVLRTPKSVLRGNLALLAASQVRPRWAPPAGIRALAEGEPAALRRLGAALHAYHRRALAPFAPHIRAQVDADLAARARAALAGGTDGLLASFRPVLRWEPPVLEANYPVERELRLGGRGLLLQPSFFCSRRPVMLAAPSPERAPVLVYPIQHTLGWARPRDATQRDAELGVLLGRTRAAILEDVVTGRTTGELARRVGISGAAASQHTAVLRQAGLLLSVRRSRHVLHTITPAGLTLLGGPPGAPFDV